MELKTKKHLHPIWYEKANFIIRAKIFNEDNQLIGQEHIWAKWISEKTFEICCIPFFIYDLSLADVVETDIDQWITSVMQPSGHYTFRVWFGDSKSDAIRDEVIDRMTKEKLLYEWHSRNLLAIDFPNEPVAASFSGYLFEKKTLNELDYETGKKKPK